MKLLLLFRDGPPSTNSLPAVKANEHKSERKRTLCVTACCQRSLLLFARCFLNFISPDLFMFSRCKCVQGAKGHDQSAADDLFLLINEADARWREKNPCPQYPPALGKTTPPPPSPLHPCKQQQCVGLINEQGAEQLVSAAR